MVLAPTSHGLGQGRGVFPPGEARWNWRLCALRARQERIWHMKQAGALVGGAGGNVGNNPIYLNRYRRSLLAKQRELLAANGGRLVLGPAGGLVGADVMDQARAESEATIDAHLSQARSRL